MSYIGIPPATTHFPVDFRAGDGVSSAFTLSQVAASTSSILVHVAGVFQPPYRYTLQGSVLNFDFVPAAGAEIVILHLGRRMEVPPAIEPDVNTVGPEQLKVDAVGTEHLQAEVVGTAEMKPGSVTDLILAEASVGSNNLKEDSVNQTHLQPDSVGSDQIQDDAVGRAHLQASSVGTDEVETGTLTRAHINSTEFGTTPNKILGSEHLGSNGGVILEKTMFVLEGDVLTITTTTL